MISLQPGSRGSGNGGPSRRAWRIPAVVLLVSLAVAGAVAGLLLAGRTPPAGQRGTQRVVDASCVDVFASLAAITARSSDIATVSVLPQVRPVPVAGVPFVLTAVRVDSVLKGSLTRGGIVYVRSLDSRYAPGWPALPAGSSNLLFLQPFQWSPGVVVAGQYVTFGCGQGVYRRAGTGAAAFESQSSAGTLPSSVTLAQVRAAILRGK